MGSGSGNSIVGQTSKELNATFKRKSSTPHFQASLTEQRKNGFKHSLLRNPNGTYRKPVRLVKTAGPYQLLIRAYRKMVEALIPAIIAIVTGTAVLFNKVNHRVTTLDTRVDKLELKLVETYTPKQEFTAAMLRMEDHLIRIEDKMDQLVNKKCN
jgi:hypothetical protein